jgi:hypothetical protein
MRSVTAGSARPVDDLARAGEKIDIDAPDLEIRPPSPDESKGPWRILAAAPH